MTTAGLTGVLVDAALPSIAALLEPESAAAVLGVDRPVRVRSLRYKPGRRLVVEYDAEARTAVAAIDRKAGPIPSVHWYPLDPALPVLALPPDGLAGALGIAAGRAERLGYKPLARAALRFGEHVVKLYATPLKFRAASAALERLSGVVPGARFERASPSLLATVQAFLDGSAPGARAAAVDAGELVARVHRLEPGSLRRIGPERRLAEAGRGAAIVAAVSPELSTRVQAIARKLAASAPEPVELVTSHGDFEPGQLLETSDGLALVDLDELCAAPPADDLGWYAAHAARGRAGDAEAVRAVLQGLVAGYGRRPRDLGWYVAASILARAPFPFRRQFADWPERLERLVAAAEAFA